MKIRNIIAASVLLAASAEAATIAVSAGFGTQGTNVIIGSTEVASFKFQVGNWDGSAFTTFGAVQSDTAKINGSVTATSPSSLNTKVIHLAVWADGSASYDVANSWAIIRTTANTAFPANVANAGSTTFNAALGTNLAIVTSKGASTLSLTDNESISGNSIVLVPEPSAALLGAFGALGLLRRRRN